MSHEPSPDPHEPSPSSTAQTVLAAVNERRGDLLALIEALVARESPSSDAAAQEPVFDLLAASLDDIGYETLRLPGDESGGQLLAAPRGREFGGVDLDPHAPLPGRDAAPPLQLLIGHCDTVWPVGTLRRMPLQIDDSIVRGPGVFDMKAGLAQAIFALRTLQRLALAPELMPLMFINSDEEVGSRESAPRIVRLAHYASRVYVMEPALGPEGKLKTARKGVGQFTVRAHGRAAHAGLDPEAGASAILELAHQVQRLFELNDPARGVNVNVGVIAGGLRPNVIAPEGEAIVDVRVPDQAGAERISAAIRGLVPVTEGVKLEITGAVERTPLERNARNQALWKMARSLAGDLGVHIEEGFAGGGSDGNLTSPVAATLDGLGAVGDGAHAVHEHIDLNRSLERCALLALLVLARNVEDDGATAAATEER